MFTTIATIAKIQMKLLLIVIIFDDYNYKIISDNECDKLSWRVSLEWRNEAILGTSVPNYVIRPVYHLPAEEPSQWYRCGCALVNHSHNKELIN